VLGEHHPPAAVAATRGEALADFSAAGWRDPVAAAIASLAFLAYFALSLFRLLQLQPTSWDLGIYTEYVKQVAQGHAPIVDVRGPGFNLLGDHFQVGLAVLAPFFRVFPSPATLLFFQSLLVAASVLPVMSAASALLGRSSGRLIGFAYGFSWGLQQMIVFDFHEIALAVPLLAFSLSALVRRQPRAAALWALPLVFIKEDQGFTVAAIGLLLVCADWFPGAIGGPWRLRGHAGWGSLLFVWGLAWSVLAITVIIPHFNAAHDYYYFKDGGVVGGGPSFAASGLVKQAFAGYPVKLVTVVMLLLPTVFAALGSPIALVALPSLLLRFISTNTAYWGTGWHYNATIMPILFIAAVDAISRWRRLPSEAYDSTTRTSHPTATSTYPTFRIFSGMRRSVRTGLARHGAPMMAAVAVALAFQFPISSLWHATTYQLGPHIAAADAAMAVVPDGATVQTTLDLLAPLAARTDTFWMGNAGNPLTTYVVFDGQNSGYDLGKTKVPAFIKQLYPTAGYAQIFARDDVYVFQRP
jgi:uncharacterized membrane protein